MGVTSPSGLELQASESNHVLSAVVAQCSQTVHAMDMPLDRAKINVANVVPVLGDNPVVLGAMDASNEQFFKI